MAIIDNLVEWAWGRALTEQAQGEVDQADRASARRLATRYGRGSVRLQWGAYVTEADLEDERRSNARFFKLDALGK